MAAVNFIQEQKQTSASNQESVPSGTSEFSETHGPMFSPMVTEDLEQAIKAGAHADLL